jgi:hypothetical protein
LRTRLRKLQKDTKGKKLSDGKPITGRGSLTDAEVNLLQQYYGLAIRRNQGNLEEIRKAVWATFFHKASIYSSPHHELCPKCAGTREQRQVGKITFTNNPCHQLYWRELSLYTKI